MQAIFPTKAPSKAVYSSRRAVRASPIRCQMSREATAGGVTAASTSAPVRRPSSQCTKAAASIPSLSIAEQHYDTLVRNLAPLRQALVQHKLYGSIQTRDHLQTFMASHVFAVWDFMSLVKTLQMRLAPTQVPWTPPKHAYLAGLINDIVAAEESDRVPPHLQELVPSLPPRASHLTLYLEAMREVGDRGHEFHRFLEHVRGGSAAGAASSTVSEEGPSLTATCTALPPSNTSDLPGGVAPFCTLTLSQCDPTTPTHQVAAAFLFGREDPIPNMFQRLLEALGPDPATYPFLRFYLERHIELDGDEHADLGRDMLCVLCKDNASHWRDAEVAARHSLEARLQLWTEIERRL
jgi:hypothetical protein